MTPEDKSLQLFAGSLNLEHLIKKTTCFNGSPTCIDLIITNRKAYFKKACILETGISDFHKLIAATIKTWNRTLEQDAKKTWSLKKKRRP